MSNISVTRFSLDVRQPRSQVTLHVGQYDTARTWKISLYDGGKPIDLTGLTPYISTVRPDGSKFQGLCSVENESEAVFRLSEYTNTALAVGEHALQLELTDGDGHEVTTAEFTMVVTERVIPPDTFTATAEDMDIVQIAASNERVRIENENAREYNENVRKSNEVSRDVAETQRQTAENERAKRDLRRNIVVDAVEDGHNVTITNPDGSVQSFFVPKGEKGDKGDPFTAKKTYPSVADMESDFANADVPEGSFIVIDTGNVEDEENARLYLKSATGFRFITDLSGAEGIKGDPGESPRIGVSDIDGGHRVTITAAGATMSFDVMDGESPDLPIAKGEGPHTMVGGNIGTNTAVGGYSGAFGQNCTAYNATGFASGDRATKRGTAAHALGQGVSTCNTGQLACGKWNVPENRTAIFLCGDGTQDAPHDAFAVYSDRMVLNGVILTSTQIKNLIDNYENPPTTNQPIIAFSIDNKLYFANNGMTWAQWVDSMFNTEGFYLDTLNEYYKCVRTSEGRCVISEGGGHSVTSNTIRNNVNYITTEGVIYTDT